MRARAWMCGLGMAVAVATAGGLLVACGTPQAKFAEVKSGEMPGSESWTGVYYNPVYGYLHMVEQDTNVVGRWKRTDSSHWGELSGTADGNVLHYTWKEHKYGAIGPSADVHGSGQFVFKMPDNKIPELDGQYAVDDSTSVADWHCVKQMNVKPDLGSITGDNPTEPAAGQDQWQ